MSKYQAIGEHAQMPGAVNFHHGIDVYGHHEDFGGATCSSGTLTCAGWATVACNGGAADTDTAFSCNTSALGGLVSSAVAGTNDKGLQISMAKPFFPATGKRIHFRTKVKMSAVAGAHNFFFGLSDKTTAGATPIMDTATISDVTHAGFYTIGGVVLVAACKNDDGGTPETKTLAKSLTTSYQVLEVIVNGVTSVDFLIDGKWMATFNAYPPDGDHALCMTFCHEGDGSSTEALTMPFIECWETV